MNSFKPWNVRHLELSGEIPDLDSDARTQGIFLVIWWYGVPLGHLTITSGQLPLPSAHLAELVTQVVAPSVGAYLRERAGTLAKEDGTFTVPSPSLEELDSLDEPLRSVREHLSLSASEGQPVSVAVCTRDRPVQLDRCLRSLQKLSHPPHEIIVVDNAPSSKSTRQVLERRPDVIYVAEPEPGLSVARNAAVRRASGEIVAFTDDDVIVHPDWIGRLRRGFSSPDVMVVTGLVLPAELETEAQVVFETHHSFSQGYYPKIFGKRFFAATQARGVPVWSIGAGANMAIRRCAFERWGGFDERLGAGASGCSEDSEIWYRVLAEGYDCRYDPGAVVYHYHRPNMEALRRQMYQYMRGHVTALFVQHERYGHKGNLRRAFGTLPHQYLRLLASRAWLGSGPGMQTLMDQVAGAASGYLYYWRHRNVTAPKIAPATQRSVSTASSPLDGIVDHG